MLPQLVPLLSAIAGAFDLFFRGGKNVPFSLVTDFSIDRPFSQFVPRQDRAGREEKVCKMWCNFELVTGGLWTADELLVDSVERCVLRVCVCIVKKSK